MGAQAPQRVPNGPILTPAYPGVTGVVRFGLDGRPWPHDHNIGLSGACHTRATSSRDQGALAVTHAQPE
jgi:hypothetical protein